MHAPDTVPVRPAEAARAIATLVTAFVADPFIRWMFPDAKRFLDCFPQVLKHFAGGAFANDAAWCTGDFAGAALWLPPGVGPDEEALGAVVQAGCDAGHADEVFAVLEQVGAGHPDEAHWYLPAVGVEPKDQGKGYGAALMARGLEAVDREHVAAYLEATNPRSIPLYERFGFEVVGQMQAGSSPAITPMFRAAR